MEPCRAAHLRCIYHGRRFTLDGRFASMPEFDGVAGFPSPADDLRRLHVERWGPFVFVALDPAFDFDAWAGPLRACVGGLPIDRLVFDRSRSRDYLVAANWALYCDNYLEGFHIPYVHAALTDAIDYGSYRTELHRWSNVQIALGTGGDHLLPLAPDAPDHGAKVAAYYFWLFPNLMFNVYAWGISVNVVRPLAVDRTKVSFLTYVWDESKLGGGAGAQLDRVEREDEMVVEACQRGIASRLYERGRYSPAREQGVHHFHRLIGDSYHFPSSHTGAPRAPGCPM
jgi:choline monooxygenase